VEHLIRLAQPPREAELRLVRPSNVALVSWNARAPRGSIELAALYADGTRSGWIPFARWAEEERRSLGGVDGDFELALDTARAERPPAALLARSDVDLDALWLATPPERKPVARNGAREAALDLDVPAYSQYLASQPTERGLCSPTSLAMLLAFWGLRLGAARVAEGVRDAAYGGTGNWAFNAAFAGSHGFAAATAYLRDLHQVRRFIAAGIPLAVSIAWNEGELPFPPLPASDGHLLVVRGFSAEGAVLVNDPAHRRLRVAYPADAFERAWLGHGGIAYLVAPAERADDLVALANG
jgi:hypothetical protein